MRRDALKKYLKDMAEAFGDEMELQPLAAKDAMIKPVILHADDSIQKIIKKLKREDCDVCIVVSKDGKFLGEIKDDDIVRIMAQTALKDPVTSALRRCYKRGMLWKKARDLAVAHNNILPASAPIRDVLEMVYRKKSQNIIVKGKGGKVVGVITLSSLISLLSKY